MQSQLRKTLWEYLSDEGWRLYPKKISSILDAACVVEIKSQQQHIEKTYSIDVQLGQELAPDGCLRVIERVVWEYAEPGKACSEFDFRDAILLEEAFQNRVGNMLFPCYVLFEQARIDFQQPAIHKQIHRDTGKERKVQRLETPSGYIWVCQTDRGDIEYDVQDTKALEAMYRREPAQREPVYVRSRSNTVILMPEEPHAETNEATGKVIPIRRTERNGTVVWVRCTANGEVPYPTADNLKIETEFAHRSSVRLIDGSIVDIRTMRFCAGTTAGDVDGAAVVSLTRDVKTIKIFRSVLPTDALSFLRRRRRAAACPSLDDARDTSASVSPAHSIWQYWCNNHWRRYEANAAAKLTAACMVPICGSKYVVDLQLMYQINTETGIVRNVRRVTWAYETDSGPAAQMTGADAVQLEQAYLAGRQPVPLWTLGAQASIDCTPIRLLKFGSERNDSGGGRSCDTTEMYERVGPGQFRRLRTGVSMAGVGGMGSLSISNSGGGGAADAGLENDEAAAAAVERAWSAYHAVPLVAGSRVVNLETMQQVNVRSRAVFRSVEPPAAEGAEQDAVTARDSGESARRRRAREMARFWLGSAATSDARSSRGCIAGAESDKDVEAEKLARMFGDFLGFPGPLQTLGCGRRDRPSRDEDLDESMCEAVQRKLANLQALIAEKIAIPVPPGADLSRLAAGPARRGLEAELRQTVLLAGGNPNSLRLWMNPGCTGTARSRADGTGDCGAVTLEVAGDAKPIAGALVARVRAALARACGGSAADQMPDGCGLAAVGGGGAALRELVRNPRLMQLSTRTPPARKTAVAAGGGWTREDAMLALAHAVVWKCGCSVYGGFVRDWVVRGGSAVDIDALIPSGSSAKAAATTLEKVATELGLICTQSRVKGAAWALTFAPTAGGGSWQSIDVDLVDPATVPKTPPGVDADVDNIMIDGRGQLCAKVPPGRRATGAAAAARAPGEDLPPLAKCVKHAQRGKFVFFYDFGATAPAGQATGRPLTPSRGPEGTAIRRLKKLLGKGLVCVSPVPPAVLQSLSPQQQALVKPKPKYSRPWWTADT